MRLLPVPFVVIALSTACVTPSEFAYLNGSRWSRVGMNTYDTRIVSVDGVTRAQNDRLFVDPGVRTIVLEAPPAAGFTWGQERTLVVKVEPCVQYWFEAKRPNPLSQDWEPRVNHQERISGCRPGRG